MPATSHPQTVCPRLWARAKDLLDLQVATKQRYMDRSSTPVQPCPVMQSSENSDENATTLTDVIHLSSIVEVILNKVALADLASLAVSSKSCAAALRPHCLDLRINRFNELQALRSLYRLSCLDELKEASLQATIGNATAGAYLGILGMCPEVRELTLVCRVTLRKSADANSTALEALVEALPLHMKRTVVFTVSEMCSGSFSELGKQSPVAQWVWQPTEPAVVLGLPDVYNV